MVKIVKTRTLKLNGKSYSFEHVSLDFVNDRQENVFAAKNNKTLRETLAHHRYKNLAHKCEATYPRHLDSPLGKFLLTLKKSGNSFYKRFLNPYGDLAYSTFSISDPSVPASRGVYTYYSGNELKYVGRCRDSMKKRVNQGYGKIHPKNCFRDGQATNCHLNAKITAATSIVTLWFRQMDNDGDIIILESELIQRYTPPWNIQRR